MNVDMLRNICAHYYHFVTPAVAVILCLCLYFEQSHLSDLEQKLAEERIKNQKLRQISKECDNEQFRLRRESILKDNKTAEIWSKLGKTENEADKCKKGMEDMVKELTDKDEEIKNNKDVRKQCATDLTDLRFMYFCFNLYTAHSTLARIIGQYLPCVTQNRIPLNEIHPINLTFSWDRN